MGVSIDRFLDEDRKKGTTLTSRMLDPVPPRPTAQETLTGRLLDGEDTTARLGLSVQRGQATDPDHAARVLRLSDRTGLASDLVDRNVDAIETEARRGDFDPHKFQASSPIVAGWLAEHPNNAAIAKDDYSRLNYLERQFRYIKNQFTAGRSTIALQEIGERAMLGTATPADRRRQAELERDLDRTSQDFGITGFFEGIPGAIANQLPIFAQTLKGKAEGAVVGGGALALGGAATGATTALIAGQAGPQIAAPEEVVTVPAAALAGAIAAGRSGAVLGWRWGAAVQAARMEGSLAYLEYEKARDADGQPLDRKTALGAAAITGIINGGLEMLGFESMLKTVPGLRALGRGELKRALVSQTMRGAFTRYARSVGEAMLTEGATEFMQDVVKNSVGELSAMIQDGSIKSLSTGAILDRIFSDEHMREAIADARAGAQAGGGTAAGFGAGSLTADVERARRATETSKVFTAIGDATKDSKLRERIPEKLQEVVERLTKDGPAETVYMPAETWNSYWQGKNLDPAAVAGMVLGNRDSYDEAQRTGADIPIPTAIYAAQLAGTEHNAFLAKELRATPNEMNAREAAELMQRLDAEETADLHKVIGEAPTEETQIQPLFPDPAAVGMTEQQASEYRAAIQDARQTAENEQAGKIIARTEREQSAVFKAERVAVRNEVAQEVNQDRDAVAMSVLSSGTLPDGSALPEGLTPIKLSRDALSEYAGQYPDLLPRLKTFGVYAKEGGVHPDEAAALLGYGSGDELIRAMLEVTEPADVRIDRITDERMSAAPEVGLLRPEEIPVEARKAVHSEQRAALLRKELEHLASNNLSALKGLIRKVTRRIPLVSEVREEAERIIDAKKVRDINPHLYLRAEQRAARQAVNALLRGDIELAFDEKQRELFNHELYRASTRARQEISGIVDHMARFRKTSIREQLAKAGGDYLAQVEAILERFDFAKSVSLRTIDRRLSLREFVEQQRQQGTDPLIPERLLNEAYRTHYRELTLSDLRGVYDGVRSIEHLAGLKNRLLASARARELDQARTEIVTTIGDSHSLKRSPDELAPSLRQRFVSTTLKGIAQHTRMEFLFDFLDGYKPVGPVWEYFFKPFVEAENAENETHRQNAAAFKSIFGAYSRLERMNWTKRRFIPEAATEFITGNLTKANILSIALNWGNAYNRDALMRGYGWSVAQIDKILDTLDERDWKTVQGIWDHIETYWPQIEQLEKDLTGVAPEKVQAAPVPTKFGELRGGYYPVIFDRDLSTKQAALDEKSSVQEMFGGGWARAMTRHGHTIERTDTGGKPIRLELSGLTDHLGAVAHDLAYRRAVIDVYRLLHDEEIQSAIEAAAGRDMYRQLNPWLGAIAGDRQKEFATEAEKLLSRARMGTTVVGLGLKVTSAVMQTLGYMLTVNELGAKYALAGLRDAYKDPRRIARQWDFITERSQMMRDRLTSYDRDVRDYARKPDLMPHDAAWFVFVGYLDLATSIPTWLGAYRKAMDGVLEGVAKGNETAAVDYADKVVRETQAAGGAKDLATVQRGSELRRLFTMFYSSMSILFNQFERSRQRFLLDKDVPRLLGTLTLVWLAPAIIEGLIRGQGPDDDEPEDWAWWVLKKELAYPFSTAVIVRDLASGLENALTSGRKDYSGSPVFEAIESAYGAAIAVKRGLSEDEEVTRSNIRDLVQTVGYFAKLPTSQLWKSGEYFHDWWTGEEDPGSVLEGLYRGLIAGKPR
jgi:hypothetical protein